MSEQSSGCGCWGILSFIGFCLACWALIFGISLGGEHHALKCSKETGVSIQKTTLPSEKATTPKNTSSEESPPNTPTQVTSPTLESNL
jgi:hypothetical protein